ncbi:MAG: hypothetical protein ACW98F_17165 [Candidatus Hodarchaeales archaeon]|jgi:hypothetical protein
MGSNSKREKSNVLVSMLADGSGYEKTVTFAEKQEIYETETDSINFEEPVYDTTLHKPHRWKLGSKMGKGYSKEHRKLKFLHECISSKENDLASKTLKRNLHFSALLTQWFPESMIDQVIVELHKRDRSKVVADQTVVIRILGYIEAFLRVSCRTIPWKTLFEINAELGMNIDKNQIAAAKFQAIQNGAYQNFYKERGNKETFDVIRFQIGRLIATLDVSPAEPVAKRDILVFSKRLCKFLEAKRIIPKDPEIYGHAIVEIACKKVLKTRNLRTLEDPRLKKKLSTAIHYIRKHVKKT